MRTSWTRATAAFTLLAFVFTLQMHSLLHIVHMQQAHQSVAVVTRAEATEPAGLSTSMASGGGGGTSRPEFRLPGPVPMQPRQIGNENRTGSMSAAPYVAICIAVKDEHVSIREWITYHGSIGVGRFYVYDDGSQPPMQAALAHFIQSGLVVYRLLDGPLGGPGEAQQMAIYKDCLSRFAGHSTWIGALDVDEFVIVMDGSANLPAVLQRYEGFGGLVVNWRVFGSSGHVTRPEGGVLQSYTKCSRPEYKPNTHVKTFGNSAHVAGASWSPHHLEYQEGYFAVTTNFTRADGPFSDPAVHDVLVINHYILKSREEFQRKISRENDMFPGYSKTQEFWDRTERSCRRDCLYAVPLGAWAQAELLKPAAVLP